MANPPGWEHDPGCELVLGQKGLRLFYNVARPLYTYFGLAMDSLEFSLWISLASIEFLGL